MGIAAILVCDQANLNKLSFSHLIKAPYGIWLWLTQCLLRCLKNVDVGRRMPTYTISSQWVFGSGELKSNIIRTTTLGRSVEKHGPNMPYSSQVFIPVSNDVPNTKAFAVRLFDKYPIRMCWLKCVLFCIYFVCLLKWFTVPVNHYGHVE